MKKRSFIIDGVRKLVVGTLCAAVCLSPAIAAGQSDAGAKGGMQIMSSAFSAGGSIPSKYTCDSGGIGVNPPLTFSSVPAKAKSLVLIMFDPDVPKTMIPSGNFDHWMVWNLSPESKGIKEADATQGINGTGKPGYYGPCPPNGEHRYFFELYALDTKLDGAAITTRDMLEAAMKGHVVEHAEYMGKYNKVKK